ncbi:hypothetical protein BRC82_02195 [Halobacteriales archaeon QS_1_67_19]|nr:MAG: hypothetical protein BRC82_02195 [Halobacteriales archaeon QS_1_67_19]
MWPPGSSYTGIERVEARDGTTARRGPDARRRTRTVQGTRTGSVRERVAAYLLDLLLVGGGIVAAARRLGNTTGERLRLGAVIGLAVANLYHVVLEGAGGQTAGKRAVGIAVELDDGSDCSDGPAAVRTLYRFVDWLPVGYLLGVAAIALTDRRKRLGDRAANSVVVRTEGPRGESDGAGSTDGERIHEAGIGPGLADAIESGEWDGSFVLRVSDREAAEQMRAALADD